MANNGYEDDRVVVLERDRGTGVGMLLLGLAIGAGAALLFAPASGRETRQRLQHGARRAGRRVRDLADEFGQDVAGRVARTRDRARDAVTSRADAVRDAVDVGREAAARAREELERTLADARSTYAERRRSSEPVTGDAPRAG